MPPSNPPPSRIQVEMNGGVAIVSFVDTVIVEEATINAVSDDLSRLVDERKLTRLVLNLGKVRKYSTFFLGKLLKLKQKLAKVKGSMKLCAIAPDLLDAVKILNLEREFDIFPQEQAALDAFKR